MFDDQQTALDDADQRPDEPPDKDRDADQHHAQQNADRAVQQSDPEGPDLKLVVRPQYRVAALVGDLATENDAIRLSRSQAPVKQITTGTLCHLEAAMIENALDRWDTGQLDYLFIENVGNLVCPSSYDLGENLRLVLLSVTEGEAGLTLPLRSEA